MVNSNKKKSEQLGMSYGKANQILRKNILFELIKICELDNCYQCNKKIKDIKNLSIEHKEHWLDSENPVEKFFDLNNIAFSHLACNIKEGRGRKKVIYKNNEKWCGKCKQFKLLEDFSPCATDNRNLPCRNCLKLRQRKFREKHK